MRQHSATIAAGLLLSCAFATQAMAVAADSEALEVHAGGVSVSEPTLSADERAEVKFCGPDGQESIVTKFGTVHVTPGSLVLLIYAPDALSVYDLHDGTDKDVFIEASGHKLPLSPGKHITLAPPRCTNFAAANKLPFVVYSASEFEQINDGLVCFRSKFDINSLILRFAPFKQLLASKEPKVRKVAEKVLKTAAIMSNYASLSRYYQLQPSPPPITVVPGKGVK